MDDGWHMIVSTKPMPAGARIEEKDGCFAEFVSTDLKNWEHKGVFSKMIWDRFLECPNVFKMGDWWYLTYSDMYAFERRVHYLKGHTLDELKAATSPTWPDNKEGALDCRAFYAGNTASDGSERYIWGWCPERRGKDNTDISADAEPKWGGSLVAHKLIQREDGTLYTAPVPAMNGKYAATQEVKAVKTWGTEEGNLSVESGVYSMKAYSSAMFSTLGYHNHISMTVTTGSKADRFGISFVRGDRKDGDTTYEKYYSIMVCPDDNGNKHYIRFEEEQGVWELKGGGSYSFVTPADNTYTIDIYTDNSVMVMYINDIVTYTQRIYGIQRNCWSVNCYEGEMTVKDIQLKQY
jgi:beta-fructofuranosidase